MKTDEVFTILLSAAAFLKDPVQSVATQSIKDAYVAAKYYLRKKFGPESDATKALDLAVEKPESESRKAVLLEETAEANLDGDTDVVRLIEQLARCLPLQVHNPATQVRVWGHGHRVQVAGRDLVVTARHVQRNAITPGDTHVSAEQRRRLAALITQVAVRLAGEDGKPRFGAVHAMLQRRLGVTSYLLIPAGRFDEAAGFLKQQCAVNRAHLRRRDPAAYKTDFLRLIQARRVELGWIKPQLYAFAEQRLGLKARLTSLLSLGPRQLKTLAEALPRAAAREGDQMVASATSAAGAASPTRP